MADQLFLSGVVEGFYGRPWNAEQRSELFELLPTWGLNTYFYAPKDDLKHRAIWRERYDDAELSALARMIQECQRHAIQFIYGLSPGLDIRFSDSDERQLVQARLAQMMDVGCEHFALLFDDLPGNMSAADRNKYVSVAAAQCDVTNDVFRWSRERVPHGRFLFCPTPYCDRMDRWNLGGAGYLDTLGEALHTEIDVIWTGPEIISGDIPLASLSQLTQRIGRKPLIWDNLHANDYDGRRVFSGPYSGRALEMKDYVAGILANPNCELPLNFVALHTLGQYVAATDTYEPRKAYSQALADWLPHYESARRPFSIDELTLLCDCFYLPYEDGERANELYSLVEQIVKQMLHAPSTADQETAQLEQFQQTRQTIVGIFEKLTELRDRELFYAWSRRVWDLREEIDLLAAFFTNLQNGKTCDPVETHHAGTYRGGFVARLQRLLDMDTNGRFSAAQVSSPS